MEQLLKLKFSLWQSFWIIAWAWLFAIFTAIGIVRLLKQFVFLLILSVCFLANADTLEKTILACDAEIATIWPQLEAIQLEEFATNDKYWQSGPTHSVEPAHDAVDTVGDGDAVPDKTDEKTISTETESWDDKDPNLKLGPLPFLIECHKYDGPQGKGALIYFSFLFEGIRYIKCLGIGPEVKREFEWKQTESK